MHYACVDNDNDHVGVQRRIHASKVAQRVSVDPCVAGNRHGVRQQEGAAPTGKAQSCSNDRLVLHAGQHLGRPIELRVAEHPVGGRTPFARSPAGTYPEAGLRKSIRRLPIRCRPLQSFRELCRADASTAARGFFGTYSTKVVLTTIISPFWSVRCAIPSLARCARAWTSRMCVPKRSTRP